MKKLLLLSMTFAFGLAGCAAESGKSEDVVSVDKTAESVSVESSEVIKELRPLLDGLKMARCVIGPDKYEGSCVFRADPNGSFYISRRDQSVIYSNVTMISVSIVEPGNAEVRGLTTEGINSRWGMATRSNEDRACWSGSDFEVCAY